MLSESFAKRNRSGNFEQHDTDLFWSLINKYKTLIDSPKQEDKRKGWHKIEENFNANCRGDRRNILALRNKLKNLKAQTRKQRVEDSVEKLDECQDTESDSPDQKKRRRGKTFTDRETALLQDLVEKYLDPIDPSPTRESLELREQAWKSITDEFNKADLNHVYRDRKELSIKFKNMKANRPVKNEQETVSIIDQETGDGCVEELDLINEYYEAQTVEEATEVLQAVEPEQIIAEEVVPKRTFRVTTVTQPSKTFSLRKAHDEFILESLDPDGSDGEEDLDEDDYAPPRKKPMFAPVSDSEKEEAQLRKNNLILKNAVLRKKERLLELQIAIAERNLRRHQFS